MDSVKACWGNVYGIPVAAPVDTLKEEPDCLIIPMEGVETAATLISEAVSQFRHYADLHAAKGTETGEEKALVNRHQADKLERALALLNPKDKEEDTSHD